MRINRSHIAPLLAAGAIAVVIARRTDGHGRYRPRRLPHARWIPSVPRHPLHPD